MATPWSARSGSAGCRCRSRVGPAKSVRVATIHAALGAGVTLVDTADAYHRDAGEVGHNETLIARAPAAYRGDTSDVLVATKGGHLRPGDGSWTVGRSCGCAPNSASRSCRGARSAGSPARRTSAPGSLRSPKSRGRAGSAPSRSAWRGCWPRTRSCGVLWGHRPHTPDWGQAPRPPSIPGSSRPETIRDSAAAVGLTLDAAELSRLDAA
ncbi:aldo/keto reductase [Amycolatopsis pigmentata]|uniref:Aldo/keto reductase n=1 Tax=Amycolatopsis pigmentata TaxID=450801 RepID=A0ABW5G0T0_9PSEU